MANYNQNSFLAGLASGLGKTGVTAAEGNSWAQGYLAGVALRRGLYKATTEEPEPIAYLYNGVELPDINTVWTDKETYPYAFMASKTANEVPYIVLYLVNSVAEYGVMEDWSSYGTCLHTTLPYSYDYYVFTYSQEDADSIEKIIGYYDTEFVGNKWNYLASLSSEKIPHVVSSGAFWTNHNIANTDDGTVYLAASDPVPVYE